MDNELKFYLKVTKRLPKIRGSGVISNRLRTYYTRQKRQQVVADVLGFKMILDPAEWVDGNMLFSPHLYEYEETAFVRSVVTKGMTFIDVGANIGFYSLIAAGLVGDSGSVIAIEADPFNYQKLVTNIGLNPLSSIQSKNVGVSDKHEVLDLWLNTSGNRGGNTFVNDDNYVSRISVKVECKPLLDILMGFGLVAIDFVKLDIEGFEYRVLDCFLRDASSVMYPRWFLLEDSNHSNIDIVNLLLSAGYKITKRFKHNVALQRN